MGEQETNETATKVEVNKGANPLVSWGHTLPNGLNIRFTVGRLK